MPCLFVVFCVAPIYSDVSRVVRLMAALLAFAAVLHAENPRTPLRDLLAEALRNHPEVSAARKRYEAARQRPTQVSSLPDPMFSPGYQSNGRPWPGAGLGAMPTSQIGFMVSQEIPFPGKRKLAGAMAEREAEAEFHQYEQTQLSLVSRVRQAYYRLAFAWSAAEVLDRNLALLGQLVETTAARYAVGRAAQQDILKAQTQISILETRKLQLARERRARETELQSLLNRPAHLPIGRPEDLRPRELLPSTAQLTEAAARQSPMLRRDEKMIQRASIATNMARREYYPDFTLNGGYYNMGGMPDMYMFRADFKIPIYFFRKQRAAVTEQVQLLAQSRRTYEATALDLRYRLEDDRLMAETSARLARAYADTVIPQAALTLESSLTSYQTGAVDLLTVLMNYGAVAEYEMNYWEELLNLHLAITRLEEMTGEQLLD